ncbi:hypothetical protein CANARDRAFT_6490 [[Candida] arabinofermentans NRRL YB-2248]|uniref:Zn(2)-C6 fungal-type domain-containing protein n=1 Tax=[Candida] arabinofermentans NRRL YB-2248 TaxID=983967 RepID=A0A1E4T588_9ASCO|nr:hypothetical protein CANARDRAFT_6490 [[Candida] arabinofermentans NRRL YB-2248]
MNPSHQVSPKLPTSKRVCSACHQRKVKCDLYEKNSLSEKCSNCHNLGYDCVIYIRKKRVISKTSTNTSSIPTKLPSYVSTHDSAVMAQINEIKLDPEIFLNISHKQCSKFKGYIGPLRSSPLTFSILNEFYMNAFLNKRPEMDETDYQIMIVAGCFNLPNQDLCWKLIHTFFDKIHPIAAFMNKTRFMKEYKDLTKPPSILLLQSILFVGSTVYQDEKWTKSEKAQFKLVSKALFNRAKLLYSLNCDMYEPIPLIQSLLLLSWNTNGVNEKNSLYFIYLSIGTAQAFGMHRDLSNNPDMSDYEKKTYRVLWWYCFIRDCSVSVSLGRPVTIQTSECDVQPLTKEDLQDDIDPDNETSYPLEDIQIEYLLQSLKIAELAQIIVKHQSTINTMAMKGEPFLHLIKQDDYALSKWFHSLPDNLRYSTNDESSQSIYSALLTGFYYTLLIVLHKINIVRTSKISSTSMHLLNAGDVAKTVVINKGAGEKEEDYYPSWGITFQAAYMVYEIFHIQTEKNYIRDKMHHFVFFMYNAANVMTYHLSNKDKKIANLADMVTSNILKMFEDLLDFSINIESMYYVLKSLYQNKPYQSVLLRSLFEIPDSMTNIHDFQSLNLKKQNSSLSIKKTFKTQSQEAKKRKPTHSQVTNLSKKKHTTHENLVKQESNIPSNLEFEGHHVDILYDELELNLFELQDVNKFKPDSLFMSGEFAADEGQFDFHGDNDYNGKKNVDHFNDSTNYTKTASNQANTNNFSTEDNKCHLATVNHNQNDPNDQNDRDLQTDPSTPFLIMMNEINNNWKPSFEIPMFSASSRSTNRSAESNSTCSNESTSELHNQQGLTSTSGDLTGVGTKASPNYGFHSQLTQNQYKEDNGNGGYHHVNYLDDHHQRHNDDNTEHNQHHRHVYPGRLSPHHHQPQFSEHYYSQDSHQQPSHLHQYQQPSHISQQHIQQQHQHQQQQHHQHSPLIPPPQQYYQSMDLLPPPPLPDLRSNAAQRQQHYPDPNHPQASLPPQGFPNSSSSSLPPQQQQQSHQQSHYQDHHRQ